MKEFIDKLREILPGEQIRTMEPMAAHTTFRVGGPADYFTEPGDEETLARVQALCRREGMASYILGNGSNLLVSDSGYRGMMILLGKAWSGITVDGSRICAGAGAMLSAVSRQAWKAGFTGLEFASGIPGTVGGAVVMNAGAYGSEMSAVLKSARVMTAEGEVLTIRPGSFPLATVPAVFRQKDIQCWRQSLHWSPGTRRQSAAGWRSWPHSAGRSSLWSIPVRAVPLSARRDILQAS